MNKNQLKKFSEDYANQNGFLLQPDVKIRDMIFTGLLKNEEKYGFRYCPCRRVTGNKEEDKKIICPCIYHKDEIKKDRHCKCMLFLKKSL
jgi:ferredoxin-thioredoxin reductase catalytic subunit